MTSVRFKLPVAVYLFLFNKQGQILLSRRYNTSWANGFYSLVAGHVEGGESVHSAMIREAKEEIGINILLENLVPNSMVHSNTGDKEYINVYFTCNNWTGSPTILEPDKCDDLKWSDLKTLPQNCVYQVHEGIKNLINKMPFSSEGFLQPNNKA